MDKAHKKTNRLLKDMEVRIADVYADAPYLRFVMREYENYMDMVEKKTRSLFEAYQSESEYTEREKKKNAYKQELKRLTLGSEKYKQIMRNIAQALALANQKALDIVNSSINEVYAVNYNNVADKCRKAGIKVNGKT